jgi:hypothetical protein
MKTNSLFWAMSWVAVGSFAIMQGCGGDDDDGGGDGGDGGGKGGSSGSATGGSSTGGSSTGGKGGSSTGGRGGSSGSSTGGAAGAPGGAGGEDSGGEGGGGTADPLRVAACSTYCSTYFVNMCETFDTDTYNDQPTCQSTCEDASWEIGTPGVAGDTVNCRLSHAGMAMAADQELHCGHASEEPTGVCVD